MVKRFLYRLLPVFLIPLILLNPMLFVFAQTDGQPDFSIENVSFNGSALEYDIRNSGTGSYSGEILMTQRWQRADGTTMWSPMIPSPTVRLETPLEPGQTFHKTVTVSDPVGAARIYELIASFPQTPLAS